MLSGELTPLLKESIELWEAVARLDVDGVGKNALLFGGTKVLQSSPGEPACMPDGGCLAVVLWPRNKGRRHRMGTMSAHLSLTAVLYYLFIIFFNYIFICFCWYGVPVHNCSRSAHRGTRVVCGVP